MNVLGLDIGGANLKAAHSGGAARSRPFPLWKDPAALPAALEALVRAMPPFDRLAVTMTGELCDCFETKRQGVSAILDAAAAVAGNTPVWVWQWAADGQGGTAGRWADLTDARATPLQAAAANWLALAVFAGRYAPSGGGLLLDIGSTTTDIIPLLEGKPVPRGRTDTDRLRCRELVYAGVRRTPVCALLGADGAAEWFATMRDVYLVLGQLPEDDTDQDTADGRPATRAAASARLARMLCADLETCTQEEVRQLAWTVCLRQRQLLREALEHVLKASVDKPFPTLITAGAGEFLVPSLLDSQPGAFTTRTVSLGQELGPEISQAACAYAVAVLAAEGAVS
jgi:probable H4MPT-linked C1 transfer pathway protein